MSLAAFLYGLSSFAVTAMPQPPAVYMDSSPAATPVTGRSIAVKAGGDLQAAIDDARPGDEIVLAAGAEFRGNFVLRNKGRGDGWITVRSSAMDKLPRYGTRVSPKMAGMMPKIVAPKVEPAITAERSAHNYRLMGLEVTVPPRTPANWVLIQIGEGTETMQGQLPSGIIFDRDYVHGEVLCHCKRGLALNGPRMAVVNSYVSEFHGIGQEAQAISAYGSPGPLQFVNNYLEAAGENLFLGGTYVALPGVVQRDVEIRNNYFRKPLKWMKSIIPAPEGVKATAAAGGELAAGRTYYYSVAAIGTEGYLLDPGVGHSGRAAESIVRTGRGRQSATVQWDGVTYGDETDMREAQSYAVLRTEDPPEAGDKRHWGYHAVAASGDPKQAQYAWKDDGGALAAWNPPWSDGYFWLVKNLLEIKNGQRVLIDGNVLDGNWQNGQRGVAVLFTPRIETEDGKPPMIQNRVQDITFTDNIVMHVGAGIAFLGKDDHWKGPPEVAQTKRILVRNNLFLDVSKRKYSGAPGWFVLFGVGQPGGASDITIDHNTVFNEGNTLDVDTRHGSLLMTNNILENSDYGIRGDGLGTPRDVFEKDFTPGVFEGNVLVGGNGAVTPGKNYYPKDVEQVGFVNLEGADFRLKASSKYHDAGTDGLDVGAIMELLHAATATAMSGEGTAKRGDVGRMIGDFKAAAGEGDR